MNTLRRFTVTFVAAAVVASLATVLAHEVTHNGTVVALKTAKYAQPSGGSREVRELEVAVVDPKTKKVANRVFTITDKTKITRAGKAVAVADVTAQKDEKVAVVVDHDKPGDEAIQCGSKARSRSGSVRYIGATGSTNTSENDHEAALSTNRRPSMMSPALGRPVAT
jgi:hypothetical protein